ncbi:MAG: hypothetical protein IPO17_14650 [Flavobacteriales bacterium]|nr:hypothetical protein [Flavobacteriales bacterium]MBK9196182.1 hypothetical protein [Flavobacteriales bacterium]
MAGKVYILTGGLQDDRRILALFSTREAAEAGLRFGDEDTEVEEFTVDLPLPSAPAGHSLWTVQEYRDYITFRVAYFHRDDAIDQVRFDGDTYTVDVWALNEEHALQLGTQRIERFKEKGDPACLRVI